MKNLAIAIKNYGHYVQPYLARVNNFNLADKYVVLETASEYTDSDVESVRNIIAPYELTIDNPSNYSASGVSFSYSLNLDADTTINLTIKRRNNYTGNIYAYVNGSNVNRAIGQTDGTYIVKISDLAAHELANTQTVKICADREFTIQASALTFVHTSLTRSYPEDRQKAAVALYKYYEATMAYRDQNQ